ncbi:MAG: nicotinate (nicotinamide) nucleotide adenylyltransferase [Chitinophagales bacterium]|nr:nicotinate (nicotinamide) nucleotide adenylyltransferase [Chitinophagales bacterium]
MIVGLFFGSFNPIHQGHLIIAEQVLSIGKLDEVWFVVSPQNPLKDKKSLLGEYDRLHMVQEAIWSNEKFKACSIEFNLPKPSYTIDTLAHLGEKYPQHQFSLIMGSDSYLSLPKWKNFHSIINNYKIIVYPRSTSDSTKIENNSNTVVCQVPLLNVSASYIRYCIQEGISIRYLVPDNIKELIEASHWYR